MYLYLSLRLLLTSYISEVSNIISIITTTTTIKIILTKKNINLMCRLVIFNETKNINRTIKKNMDLKRIIMHVAVLKYMY